MKKLIVLLMMGALLTVASLPAVAQDANPAYLRIGHFAADAPDLDVFLSTEAIASSIETGNVSDFVEVQPGESALALAETGTSADDAILNIDVPLIAGHRVTVAIVGQMADDSLDTLVIDETALIEDVDLSQGVFRIIVNNIAGVPKLSFYEADMWVEQDIPYAGYSAALYPAFSWDTGKAVVGDDLNNIVFDFDPDADQSGGFWEPYTVYTFGTFGKHPGSMFEDNGINGGQPYVVAPDVSAFLAAFSNADITSDYQTYYRFDNFVQALEIAGLNEMLADGAHTIFVPTDQAFAALPEGRLDALLADPDALRDVLLAHIVEGAYNPGQLMETKTFTAMNAATISIEPLDEDGVYMQLNGKAIAPTFGYPFIYLDGTWVYFIDDTVLL